METFISLVIIWIVATWLLASTGTTPAGQKPDTDTPPVKKRRPRLNHPTD